MPSRTRISNGKLAVGFLVGFAALGLGPVAHMMLNPAVSRTLDLMVGRLVCCTCELNSTYMQRG
jgi:glycerol uptake facilitator-like aquaporin